MSGSFDGMPAMDAQEWIEKLMDTYARCSTYQDVERLTMSGEWSGSYGYGERELIFKTRFVRPKNLYLEALFESRGSEMSSILWSKDGDVFSLESNSPESNEPDLGSWYQDSSFNRSDSLSEAFNRLTRPGRGRGRYVLYPPTLLIPELKCQAYGFFDNLFCIDESEPESHDTIHLRSSTTPQMEIQLWLRKSDCALLKLRIERVVQKYPSVPPSLITECVYEKVIFDQQIPEEIFAFQPKTA